MYVCMYIPAPTMRVIFPRGSAIETKNTGPVTTRNQNIELCMYMKNIDTIELGKCFCNKLGLKRGIVEQSSN